MKPKGKIQTQLVEWAGMLPPLDEKRKEWAKGLFKPQALYYSRRGNNCEFWCQCCGAIVPTLGKWLLADYAVDKWTCPECGAECEVLPQYSGGWGHNYDPKTRRYSSVADRTRLVTMADVFKGAQVFRTFEVSRWNCRDGNDEHGRWRTKPTEYHFAEVWQNWVFENGKEYITSKPYTRSPFSFSWHYCSGWGIARHNGHCTGQYVMEDVFELDGHEWFPGKKIIPILRRNGLKGGLICRGVDPAKLSIALLKDNRIEELVKSRQLRIAMFMIYRERWEALDAWMHAIRICTRNKYIVKDPDLWFDYLDDLVFLGLDTHSPHYVCPKDLRKAHARTSRRRERIEEARKMEEQAREAKKWETRYAVAKAPFLGIVFGDDTVVISVLQTVEDVRLEGKAMHHCVFANGYYKKHDRVLLSARDMKGNRLETIEIGLDPFKVLQSRGLQNGSTKEHQRIVELCNTNMDLFRRAVPKMTVPLHLTGKNANYYQD